MTDIDETIAGYAARHRDLLARACDWLGRTPRTVQCVQPARWSVNGKKTCDDHLPAAMTADGDRRIEVESLGVVASDTPDAALAAASIPVSLDRLQNNRASVSSRIAALAAQRDGMDRLAAWLDAPKLRAIAALVEHGVSFTDAARALWTLYWSRCVDADFMATPPSEIELRELVATPIIPWEDRSPEQLAIKPAECTMYRGPCACGSWHQDSNWTNGRWFIEVAGRRGYGGSFGPEPDRIAALVAGRTE